VRIDAAAKKRWSDWQKHGPQRSFLAAEAINEYLDVKSGRLPGSSGAIASLDRGEGVSHERVKDWVTSGAAVESGDLQALMTLVWSLRPSMISSAPCYIEQDDPAAAHRVAIHVIQNVETLLPGNPEMGRPGRVPEHATRDPEDVVHRAVRWWVTDAFLRAQRRQDERPSGAG